MSRDGGAMKKITGVPFLARVPSSSNQQNDKQPASFLREAMGGTLDEIL